VLNNENMMSDSFLENICITTFKYIIMCFLKAWLEKLHQFGFSQHSVRQLSVS